MLCSHTVHKGRYQGDIALTGDLEFHGLLDGSIRVASGLQLLLHGRIAGDLVVEKDALVAVHGAVTGTVMNYGAHVRISGSVGRVHDIGHRKTHIQHGGAARKANPLPPAERAADATGAFERRLIGERVDAPDALLDAGLRKGPRAGWSAWITE